MIERIVFYGTTIPISLLLIGFLFYVSRYSYEEYIRTKDLDPRWHIATDKYSWLPFFLLGLCTLIGAICLSIGFEYNVMGSFK